MLKRLAFFLLLLSWSPALGGQGKDTATGQVDREYVLSQTSVPVFTYRVVQAYPHSSASYTEGLVLDGGFLYEGTGRYGRSTLSRLELATGKPVQTVELNARYFGEGVTVMGERIYQLTYKSNVGFVYDKSSLELVRRFTFLDQGWGLTHDGKSLIMSNGSAALIFLDPDTMERRSSVIVTDDQGPVGFLNELEYIDGQIYANIWQTDLIARITPETGKINAWLDLTGLNPDPDLYQYPFVLNGIAWNPRTAHLLVTGKCWPSVWEIELVPYKR